MPLVCCHRRSKLSTTVPACLEAELDVSSLVEIRDDQIRRIPDECARITPFLGLCTKCQETGAALVKGKWHLYPGDGVAFTIKQTGGYVVPANEHLADVDFRDEDDELRFRMSCVEAAAASANAGIWGPLWVTSQDDQLVWHPQELLWDVQGQRIRLAAERPPRHPKQTAEVLEGDDALQGVGCAGWSEDIAVCINDESKIDVYFGRKLCIKSQHVVHDWPLRFSITMYPSLECVTDIRRVQGASLDPRWYQPYRMPDGLRILLVDTAALLDQVVDAIQDRALVAVDCEWADVKGVWFGCHVPWHRAGKKVPSLVQIGVLIPADARGNPVERMCFLLDMHECMGQEFLSKANGVLEKVFAHADVFAWSFNNDAKWLLEFNSSLATSLQHVVDLQPIVQEQFALSDLPSLGTACKKILGRVLDKSMQSSEWAARPLSDAQIHYAACDAYVLLAINARLEELWRPTDVQVTNTSMEPITRVASKKPRRRRGRKDSQAVAVPEARKDRCVPAACADEYADHDPIELKDGDATTAEELVRILYQAIRNGESRVAGIKPHHNGNRYIVFVPKSDVVELYDAYKQPEFKEALQRARAGTRRRPRLAFPPFNRESEPCSSTG